MLEKSVLERLDKYAYNRPEAIPGDILRADKAAYRVYFRFMCCLYMMHRNGTLGIDELKKIKAAFLGDLELYDLYQNAAIQGAREFQKLNFALHECRENAENCEICRKIAAIRGAAVTANEPDAPGKPGTPDVKKQEE